jgi:hypothetical protein
MHIIAYAFLADVHCIDCTRRAFQLGELVGSRPAFLDAHGLPQVGIDRERNTLAPIFSTDEQCAPLVCGACLEPID